MADDGFSRRFTFELGLGLPMLLVAVVLSALFVIMPNWRTELTYIALVCGGTAAIYSAFYMGAAARERANRQRMTNTYALIRDVDHPELLKLREVLDRAINHRSAAPAQILSKINEEVELRIAVRGLLNVFEDIAVAVRMGYADERLVCACLRSLMTTSAEKYGAFIEAERNRHNTQTVYGELGRVTGSWRNGRYHTLNREIPTDLCQRIRRRS